jgi:predicted glycogen debranching enzyme
VTRKASKSAAASLAGFRSPLAFGQGITANLRAAEEREWLVTNGLGGFASGTVAGLLTRRYHGLLLAAFGPPLRRMLLVAKLDETASYQGATFPLFTNRWASGVIDPHGYRHIESFHLDGTTPVWTFACADARVEKRIWMEPFANTTYVRYALLRGGHTLTLFAKALVNSRDYHALTHSAGQSFVVLPVPHGLRILPPEGAAPFYLFSATGAAEPAGEWYQDFELAQEVARGLDHREDHLHAGTFHVELEPGHSFTLVASTDPAAGLDGDAAWSSRQAYERHLLDRWTRAAVPRVRRLAGEPPAWISQLVLAADQFIIQPRQSAGREEHSIIAGYPWFGEWGRDTMVSLPGLTLATGRPEIARDILRAWARRLDRGMLPNRLAETDGRPEYNSVDATLWYFQALREYDAARRDDRLLRELFPLLAEIVEWHVRGTRHGIQVDSNDGLLRAGEPGMQLTWMDAKVGDWVVTPRIGKPVEVNALWLNALVALKDFARRLKRPAGSYQEMARRAAAGFERFWNKAAGCCFDIIDGPAGDDASLRPNQILAVSLPASPLTLEQQRAVVDACARQLLTPFGVRSLAPGDAQYRGRCEGGPRERDAAYHQGTVWGWLLGAFVSAHLRVYQDPGRAASLLEAFEYHLKTYGLGTAGEIFDGDPPFSPRGCIAQAWTVAEILRAWLATATFDGSAVRAPQGNGSLRKGRAAG